MTGDKMNPSISDSVKSGVNAANKGLQGIGLYAAGWTLAAVFSVGAIMFTFPPVKAIGQVVKNRPPAAAPATTQPVPSADEAAKAQGTESTPEEKEVKAWALRALPVMILAGLFLMVAGIFLFGGQVGYLAKLVRGEAAKAADFLEAAKKSFKALFAAAMLSIGLGASIILVIGGLIALTQAVLPKLLAVVVTVLLALGLIAVIVWLGIRLFFWQLAVPADRLGPIEAWKASFRATKGRWGQVFLFSIVLWLISLAVNLVFRLLGSMGALFGAGVGGFVAMIVGLLSIAGGLYVSFLTTAAIIRYFDETKKSGEQVFAGTPPTS